MLPPLIWPFDVIIADRGIESSQPSVYNLSGYSYVDVFNVTCTRFPYEIILCLWLVLVLFDGHYLYK